MAKRFPLQPLLELAQNHTDAAARELHRLKLVWQESEEKLIQLKSYQDDYRAKLVETTKIGMQATSLRDFHLFLAKLEAAIRHQMEEVARCKRRWEDGKLEWHAKQRKLKAFDTLSQRHHRDVLKRENKLEQREQDELSGREFEQEKPDETPEN